MKGFTPRADRALTAARHNADYFNAPYIGTEHLLLALAQDDGGVAHALLHQKGITPDVVRTSIRTIQGGAPQVEAPTEAPSVRKLIGPEEYAAYVDALNLTHAWMSHAALGNDGRTSAAEVLEFFEAAHKALREQVRV